MEHEKAFVPTKLTLLTILLASTLILMGGAAVAPALPQIQAAYPSLDPMMIDLVVTLPSLAIAASGIAIGFIADRKGKVNVLIPSLLLFAVSGLAGFFVEDFWILLVARFLVGISIAGISSCCTALLTEYYHGDRLVKTLGYQTAAMGFGVLILEVGGGSLAEMGWHQPFLIYSIGFLIFLMALVSVREPTHEEWHGADSGRFNKQAVIACYVVVFITMMAMFSIPTKLAAFVAENTDATSTMTGLILGLNGILNSFMCLSYHAISKRIDRKYLVAVAFLLMSAGLLMFHFAYDVPTILLCTCLMGMGVGLGSTTVVNTLSSNVSPTRSGMIMGGYATFLNLGQFSATFVVAALISLTGGLREMYVSMGMITLAAALVFFVIMPRVDRDR